MAVERLEKTQLRLVFKNGTHPTSGNAVYKTKSFNNIHTNATADGLYIVGMALAGLQTLSLARIERNDHSMISDS